MIYVMPLAHTKIKINHNYFQFQFNNKNHALILRIFYMRTNCKYSNEVPAKEICRKHSGKNKDLGADLTGILAPPLPRI